MHLTTGLIATAAVLLYAAGAANAGSGNEIRVIQERTFGTGSNTLTVDQSGADQSLVGGLQIDAPLNVDYDAALQRGDGNSATLTIEGNGGVIQLLQDNSGTGAPGNQATVDVSNGGFARVGQLGSGNLATLSVSGALAEGNIFQVGTNNQAGLEVSGTNARGNIAQQGSGIETNLAVTGAGTSVDYTVNGSNITNVPGGGVQVFTNGATVTITQTQF